MPSIIKSSIEKLESAAASAKADLHKVRSQHEAASARAAELANKAADAFADLSPDADAVEEEHAKAALREKSLSAAVSRAEERLVKAEQALAAERDRAAREASAAHLRQLAKDVEKLKPAAAKATLAIAEIVGQIPVTAVDSMSGANPQILRFWVPACGFYNGDVLDVTADTLRRFADEIVAGNRSADLGSTIDVQADLYGRKPLAKAS